MGKNKLEQVNQAYKRALAQVLIKELPHVVELTVTDVLIDPSYQHGKVWLKTTPEILEQIEEKRSSIVTQLNRFVQTRYTPKLSFHLDSGEIDQLDQLFEKIETKQ